MENNRLTTELINLEKKYWKAMQDHDLEAATSLTSFPCLVAGPSGAHLVNEDEYRKMFEMHKDSSMQVEFVDEPKVRMLNANTAAIAYQIVCDMKVNGKEEKMRAVDTSTWAKQDGKWACFHHTETPLKQQ